MSQFELNWVGEYIPQNVAENDFLNSKLENDTYGIYYSVQFQGDADTYLLQAKKAPVPGQPEWGMIEMSKSGKSKRFKRVKREDGQPTAKSATKTDAYLKDVSDMYYRVWYAIKDQWDVRTLHSNAAESADFWAAVDYHTTELLNGIEKIRSGTVDNQSKEGAIASPAAALIHDKLKQGFGKAITANDDLASLEESLGEDGV